MPFDDDLEEATPISRDPQRYRSERELERVRVTKNTRKNKRREREVSRALFDLCVCAIQEQTSKENNESKKPKP